MLRAPLELEARSGVRHAACSVFHKQCVKSPVDILTDTAILSGSPFKRVTGVILDFQDKELWTSTYK